MTASIQPFAIGEVSIRQQDGLFSLNDLHRASGGEAKHQPALFLRLDQTQALVSEISSSTDSQSLAVKKVLGKGKAQGTYACRELVIAYAAWISAAFHLKVIRVFLDVAAPQERPYSVSPDQTLSAEQAQTLRSLLQDFAKSMPKDLQAQIMVQGWSKLKAHFKVDYRHIPANQFTEAVSILSRHIAQWAPADPQKTTAPALDLTGGPAAQAAHEAAMQYIDNLRSGQQQRWDLPPEVLQGLVLDALMSQRFIVSFGYRQGMSINPIARDAYVLPSSQWASAIESGDAYLPPEELARLANVCTQRMARALQRRLPPAQPPALA